MAKTSERFSGVLTCGDYRLDFSGRTLVAGVLNVTPDSFSDGGRFINNQRAVKRALDMEREGADIIDIGGQSTRPGSKAVGAKAELERIMPVLKTLADQLTVPISIDTTEAEVARRAVEAGADIINDVSALRFDDRMAKVAAECDVPVILMHMQGTPEDMQQGPHYDDVIGEIKAFLRDRIKYAVDQGIDRQKIIIDPGIGFGKRLEHNLTLLANIEEFYELGRPVMVGHSRKSFMKTLLNLQVDQRDMTTVALSGYLANKGVHIVRVHEVGDTRNSLELIRRLNNEERG